MPKLLDPIEDTAALAKADKSLGKLIRRVGPCSLQPENLRSPFHALARAIIYQQLSGKAAATIFGRIEELFPRRRKLHPEDIVEIDDQRLRSAGASRNKVLALKDLAAKTLDGTVPSLARMQRMEDEEILSRLVAVRGIGPWTVEMLLIFRLGRADVFPVSDLGVRKGFMLTYRLEELPSPTEMIERGERWRPYRSIASWYLWRAVDLHLQDKKQPRVDTK
jgi:DNA-3-methyladenine glycosylase II